MPDAKLRLQALSRGMGPAITPAFGGSLSEAAAVCLDNQGHAVGVIMTVRGSYQADLEVFWPKVTKRMKRCYNDLQEATEHGAYGIAILLSKKLLGFVALERSAKGTGFDYWIGENDPMPFQKKGRLEVSGILQGSELQVKYRVASKQKQTKVSDARFPQIPAYAAVVEFGKPTATFNVR